MKISKTLKRLRSERGMTQEALAEKLFISRQSVSSWENDRTQPDIEMLGRLSEIFEVSVEELIYGKKRNVTLETEKPDYSGTLTVVFAILGSLLAGTGVVLIFVYFWQKMPMFSKAILSFLPLLAGQSSGIFVFFKKKDSLPWREGASVLWTAGIAATLTMIYNIFDLSIYWYTVLIIVSVLIAPVILLLKASAPVIVYYSCIIVWCFTSITENAGGWVLLVSFVLIAVGCLYTAVMLKRENLSPVSIFMHWLSVIAAASFIVTSALVLEGEEIFGIGSLGAVGLCLLVISLKEQSLMLPYRIPGLLLTSVMLFAGGIAFFGFLDITVQNLLFSAVLLLSVPLCFIFTKNKKKDRFFLLYMALCYVFHIVFSVAPYFITKETYEEKAVYLMIFKIIAVIANIFLMVSGAREKKLLSINTGFISVGAVTYFLIWQSGLSLIGNGLLLLIFGAVLLTFNYRFTRRKVKTVPPSELQEVNGDEK